MHSMLVNGKRRRLVQYCEYILRRDEYLNFGGRETVFVCEGDQSAVNDHKLTGDGKQHDIVQIQSRESRNDDKFPFIPSCNPQSHHCLFSDKNLIFSTLSEYL
mmetsp:Transcript_4268/g.16089  ORF Transcript_4268/g.16089 Transcript_4268/m.16089 type:complete len:103 (+) Transcript_4268:5488-5796(+)